MPSGAVEEDAVFTIAKAMWRKRRAQNFLKVRLMLNSLDISHPAFDEVTGLRLFAGFMWRKPETAFEEHASRLLSPDKINHLKQKFPRSNFKSDSEWGQAVFNEIINVLPTPAPPTNGEEPEDCEEPELLREAQKLVHDVRKLTNKFVDLKPAALSSDLFEQELVVGGAARCNHRPSSQASSSSKGDETNA